MIRFWKNTTGDTPVSTDDVITSYLLGTFFVFLFLASFLLNTISFCYQHLNKRSTSRLLFQLQALTDLLTTLYHPLYAAHLCFKQETLPHIARVELGEALAFKLVSIPIYMSIVITSLLSISRYMSVRDPLSVKRGSIKKKFVQVRTRNIIPNTRHNLSLVV